MPLTLVDIGRVSLLAGTLALLLVTISSGGSLLGSPKGKKRVRIERKKTKTSHDSLLGSFGTLDRLCWGFTANSGSRSL